jgi:hypothetical protein
LNPQNIGSFKILERIEPVVYNLELPEELKGMHDVFYVSNLKKYLINESLMASLDENKLMRN